MDTAGRDVDINHVTLNVIQIGGQHRRSSMWTIIVLIYSARATRENVVCDVRFTANGGPHDGAMLEKQFVYTYPTSPQLIVDHLTEYASMLKVSFDSPAHLEGTSWEV